MWNQNPTERRQLTINYAQASDQPYASIAFILQASRTQEAIESVVSEPQALLNLQCPNPRHLLNL
jgi:hypothetical protein